MDVFDLQAVLRLDSSAYDRGLDEAKQNAEKSGNFITGGLKTIGKLGAAAFAATGAGVAAFAKSAVSAGTDFDSAMSQVAATMGVTTDEIQELNQFAQEMGRNTSFSATQAAEALNFMALAGYDAETSMAMLPNVLNLAAAGGIDLAYASDMVTDASSALGLSIDETTTMVDQMAKTSSKSNTSVQQLGEAILTIGATARSVKGGTTELNTILGVLADNGIKGAEGGTHLRNILLSLQNPTDDAKGIMDELGIAIYDADGNMRSMVDIVGDLQGSLEGMDSASKDAIVSGIFNKTDLASVNALLNTSRSRFDQLTDEIEDATGAAQAMADTQLDNLAGDVTLFQSALEGAKIAVSNKLTPSLRKLVQFGSKGISDMTAAFEKDGLHGALEVFNGLLDDAISGFADKFPEILDTVSTVMGGIVSSIAKNAPKILTSLADVVLDMAGQLVDGIPDFIEGATKLFISITEGITKSVPDIVQKAVELIPKIVSSLLEHTEDILKAGVELFVTLGKSIIEAIPAIVAEIPTLITSLGEGLLGGIKGIWEGISGVFSESYETMSESERLWIEKLGEERQALEDTMSKRSEAFSDTSAESNYYQSLWDELQGIVDQEGNIKKGYEDRAQVITTVLSEALGLEIEIVGNQIQKYDELGKKVEETIKKKQAEALLAQDQDRYAEAISNVNRAYDDMIKAAGNAEITDKQLNKALDRQSEALAMVNKDLSDEELIYWSNEVEAADAEVEALNKQLAEEKAALDDATAVYSDYAGIISQNQGLMAAVAEGDIGKMDEAINKMTNDFRDSTNATKEQLVRQRNDYQTHYNILKRQYESGNTSINKQQVDAAKKLVDDTEAEIKKAEKKLPSTLKQALEAGKQEFLYASPRWGGSMKEAADAAIEKAEQMVPGFSATGKNAMDALSNSVYANQYKVEAAARNVANAVQRQLNQALEIHSPSRVMMRIGKMIDEGLAVGIEDNAPIDEAYTMASNVVGAVEDAVDDNEFVGDVGGQYEDTQSVVINMNIYGAAGQDVEELANIVSEQLANQLSRRKAVYA